MLSAKCRHPAAADEHIKIMGYNDPAVEGSSITFGCSSGLESTTSICMNNGEWEPDPRESECNISMAIAIGIPQLTSQAIICTNCREGNQLLCKQL